MTDHEVLELDGIEFQGGLTLRDAKLAYKTYGKPNAARDNVVLMPTFFGGQHLDNEPMIGEGRALDPSKYFIIVPNLFGNGLSSSPSNSAPPFDEAAFPRVTIHDNVVCQHRLVTKHLGIERVKLVVGFSVGAQQAFQWGAMYSETTDAIAPLCGSARTSPPNALILEGVKAALTADGTFADGWYEAPPVRGLRALSRVYAGWVFSQGFFRKHEYRKMGLASVEDTVRFVEGFFRQRDANDLLAMLWTWQHADISSDERYGGDLSAALGAIDCKAMVIPSTTDLIFRVRDNELEVEQMPDTDLRPIPSLWEHAAAFGVNPFDNQFIDSALRELLAA